MTTSSLQPLPIEDSSLLNDFFQLHFDAPALAAKRHRHLPDIIAWSLTAPIQAYIAAFRYLANLSRVHRETKRLNQAMDATVDLLKATTDPKEKRLLIGALIRGTTALLNPRTHSDEPTPPRTRDKLTDLDQPAAITTPPPRATPSRTTPAQQTPTHTAARPTPPNTNSIAPEPGYQPPLPQAIDSYLNTNPYEPFAAALAITSKSPLNLKNRQRSPANLLACAGAL